MVGAVIEEGRGEGAQQAVMRDLDLDPVEPAVAGIPGADGKAIDGRSDIVQVHCLG